MSAWVGRFDAHGTVDGGIESEEKAIRALAIQCAANLLSGQGEFDCWFDEGERCVGSSGSLHNAAALLRQALAAFQEVWGEKLHEAALDESRDTAFRMRLTSAGIDMVDLQLFLRQYIPLLVEEADD